MSQTIECKGVEPEEPKWETLEETQERLGGEIINIPPREAYKWRVGMRHEDYEGRFSMNVDYLESRALLVKLG